MAPLFLVFRRLAYAAVDVDLNRCLDRVLGLGERLDIDTEERCLRRLKLGDSIYGGFVVGNGGGFHPELLEKLSSLLIVLTRPEIFAQQFAIERIAQFIRELLEPIDGDIGAANAEHGAERMRLLYSKAEGAPARCQISHGGCAPGSSRGGASAPRTFFYLLERRLRGLLRGFPNILR